MKTPSCRKGANRMTKHHMLRNKEGWSIGRQREAWKLRAYQMEIKRDWHDRLEVVTTPIAVPHIKVVDALVEIGRAHNQNQDIQYPSCFPVFF